MITSARHLSLRPLVPLLIGLSPLGLFGSPRCVTIGPGDEMRLTTYAQKKYKIPLAVSIELASSSRVGTSCFQKLEFRAKDPKSSFHLTLFASPDLRYLSRDLLDTFLDPIEEERRQAREFMSALAHGAFPSLGPNTAAVTLTVFSDFQCPYCARLAQILKSEVLPQEAGRIRLVFRHYPLSFHSWARTAAEVTSCAADQNNEFFWRLHDYIFEHQQGLTPDNVRQKLIEEAKRSRGFDQARLSQCLAEKKVASRIDKDIAFGTQAGVQGTPTVFVNGFRATSASSAVQIRSLIREQIRAQQLKPVATGN